MSDKASEPLHHRQHCSWNRTSSLVVGENCRRNKKYRGLGFKPHESKGFADGEDQSSHAHAPKEGRIFLAICPQIIISPGLYIWQLVYFWGQVRHVPNRHLKNFTLTEFEALMIISTSEEGNCCRTCHAPRKGGSDFPPGLCRQPTKPLKDGISTAQAWCKGAETQFPDKASCNTSALRI